MTAMLDNLKRKFKIQNALKAMLCAFSLALVLSVFSFLICWLFTAHAKFLISGLLFSVSFLILIPIFYLKKFRYADLALARKIDQLGLEERVITMLELKNDESVLAKKQRADTFQAINSLDLKSFKGNYKKPVRLSVSTIALTCLILVLAWLFPNAGSTIIAHGETTNKLVILSSGNGFVIDYNNCENKALVDVIKNKKVLDYIAISNCKDTAPVQEVPMVFTSRISMAYTYMIGNDATIVLDSANFKEVTYEIYSNEAHTLMALPQKGYVFIGWSDGVISPFRDFQYFNANGTLEALFEEVATSDYENLPDAEKEPGDEDTANKSSGESEGGGKDPSGSGKTNIDCRNGNGAKESPANQVINGETYYGDIFNQSYQEALNRIKNNSNLTEAQKKAISDYFESIRKS